MTLQQFLFWFLVYGNLWASQGYVYDLHTGWFVHPATGERRAVTAWEKPERENGARGVEPKR
jgi:hypothetical protein